MKHIKILTLAALACSLGAAALELPEQLRQTMGLGRPGGYRYRDTLVEQ